MKLVVAVAVLTLAGCAKPEPKPVVILGNHTRPTVCECPQTSAQRTRADAWKAYAEKLETRMGIPHKGIR